MAPDIYASSCLNQNISYKCVNRTTEEVLDDLEQEVNCSFSYNSLHVNLDSLVDINVMNTPLKAILNDLVSEDLEIKQRGRYILFTSIKNTSSAKQKKSPYIVEGTVRNAKTGELLRSTSIYVLDEKTSVLTDESGFYRLELESKSEEFGLSYSKQLFLDTLIVIRPNEPKKRIDIALNPRASAPDKMPIKDLNDNKERPVEDLSMVQFIVPEVQRTLSLNYAFLEDIPVQFSLLPSIGTNRLTGGQKTSTVSVNLISGYNAAVEGIEAGGFLNIVRKDVTGAQFSGFGNIVGGKVKGLQTAGFFNNTLGSIHGIQAAGFANVVFDTIAGVQAAGFANVLNGAITGAQLAGFTNIARNNCSGLQAAGFFNSTIDTLNYAQLSGFANHAGVVNGLQAAGYVNTAKLDVAGAQLAGFVNASKTVTGMQAAGFMNVASDASIQIAGFINVAKKISGVQLGVFNFNDSSNLSIGLLSFSVKGMKSLEFHTDEIHPYNLSFRTGNRRFYNILEVGYGSYTGLSLWSYSYGVGTQFGKPEKRINFNLELKARSLLHIGAPNDQLAINPHFDPLLNIRIGKKRPAILIGPTFNALVANRALNSPRDGQVVGASPNYPNIYDPVESVLEVDFWVGGKLAIRV